MAIPTPSIAQLQRAIALSEQIEKLEAELKSVLSQSTGGVSTANGKPGHAEPRPTRKKSGMSAEGRARIVAAQKARWAKSKGQKPEAPAKAKPAAKADQPVKKKRTMSPEARARIVAAQKKRWARFRKALPKVSRKERHRIANAGQPAFNIF